MADKGLMAPNGDIFLVVGSASKKLRVSSSVLSAASPVFKTILDPKSREIKQPRSNSTEPTEVSLPSDDPDAMFRLCALLHLNSFNASDNLTLTSEAIFNLVLLADKYSAITAIRWHLRSALLAWLLNHPETSDVTEFGRIITAAYMINCSKAFEKATAQLIIGSAGRLSVLLNAPFNKVLPARILGEWLLSNLPSGVLPKADSVIQQLSWESGVMRDSTEVTILWACACLVFGKRSTPRTRTKFARFIQFSGMQGPYFQQWDQLENCQRRAATCLRVDHRRH